MTEFITSSDVSIIMDCNEIGVMPFNPDMEMHALKLDDLKRLHDAGATVALEFAPWTKVETSAGVRDWSYVDEMVTRARAARLKVLLMGPTDVPPFFADDWYVRLGDGTIGREKDIRNPQQTWACLSPWCEAAQDYQALFVAQMCKRYNSADVMCIFSHSQEGEALLPPAGAFWYDDHALESYTRFTGRKGVPQIEERSTIEWLFQSLCQTIIDLQSIYVTHPSHEVFMSLHPVYTTHSWRGSGVVDIEGYFNAVIDYVKPSVLHWLIFSYFPPNFKGMRPLVRKMRDKGIRITTGAEFSQGLRDNTPDAINEGIRSLLVAPIHPFINVKTVDDWVLDNVRYSRKLMLEANESILVSTR